MTLAHAPIVFVHNSLPIGGAEQLRLAMCRELLERNVPFRVCALECPGAIGEELKSMGVPLDVLHTKQWVFDVRVWFKLHAYFKQHQPSIVQSSLFEANTHCRLIAPYTSVPVLLCEEHGLDYRRSHVHGMLDAYLQSRADIVLTVSQAVYDYMRVSVHIDRARLKVLHNCIDPVPLSYEQVADLRISLGIAADDFVVGHVGALKEEKGHRILFQAFKNFWKQHKQSKLLLIGDGPMDVELRSYAQELGMEQQVVFAGTRRDMQACFKMMDIFAFPSVNEALGIALQEAMFMGLPVIASKQGGMEELIEHENNGLLIPLQDVHALTQAMLRLKDSARLCQTLGNAAREEITQHYLPKQYVDQLFQLYRTMYRQKNLLMPDWLKEI